MRRSSLSPAKADLDEMDFGYATTIDDVFDAPVKQDDWTADDVEEGRPLLRVGSWSKDAPRSRRAKILACVTATVICGLRRRTSRASLSCQSRAGGGGRQSHVWG